MAERAGRQPYEQTWVTVHPQAMSEYVQGVNAAGWAVLAVVPIPGSHSFGVLSGPAPSPGSDRERSS